jgi:hypothetical protein
MMEREYDWQKETGWEALKQSGQCEELKAMLVL